MSTKPAHGIVHGKTIELDEDLGLSEGQEVEVRVTIVPKAGDWGRGILRSAGGWADYPELDDMMDKIQRAGRSIAEPKAWEEPPARYGH